MKGLRNPVGPHVGKTYKRRHQIKKFDKTDPQKWVILIQNTISKLYFKSEFALLGGLFYQTF